MICSIQFYEHLDKCKTKRVICADSSISKHITGDDTSTTSQTETLWMNIVTHVPWCMSGSLTCGGGENVPGIRGACATRNFMYLQRGPCQTTSVSKSLTLPQPHFIIFVEGHMIGMKSDPDADMDKYWSLCNQNEQATIINGTDQNPSFPCLMIQPLLSDCAK